MGDLEDEIQALHDRERAAVRAEQELDDAHQDACRALLAIGSEARGLLQAGGFAVQPLHISYELTDPDKDYHWRVRKLAVLVTGGSARNYKRLHPVRDSRQPGWGPISIVEYQTSGEVPSTITTIVGGWFITAGGHMVLVESRSPAPGPDRLPQSYSLTNGYGSRAWSDYRPRTLSADPDWIVRRSKPPMDDYQQESLLRYFGPPRSKDRRELNIELARARTAIAHMVKSWRDMAALKS